MTIAAPPLIGSVDRSPMPSIFTTRMSGAEAPQVLENIAGRILIRRIDPTV
jgi:hypothetical protein